MKKFIWLIAFLLLVSLISLFIHCEERCKDLEKRSPKTSQKVKLVGCQWDKILMLEQKIDDQTNQIAYLITWQEAQTKILNDLEAKLDRALDVLQKETTDKETEKHNWW